MTPSLRDEPTDMPARPLRNRVLATGEIVAHQGRGLYTGNRGRLAKAPGVMSGRRWTTRAWICCLLSFRGRRRVPMQPGRWTELFFLDEAVALAAGHRPCAECRRADYLRFRAAWTVAFGSTPPAPGMDAVLHAARTAPHRRARVADLPDGSFIRTAEGPALLWRGHALTCDPGAYLAAAAPPVEAEVLTPAPLRAVLAAGYRPVVHPSAAALIPG